MVLERNEIPKKLRKLKKRLILLAYMYEPVDMTDICVEIYITTYILISISTIMYMQTKQILKNLTITLDGNG